MLNINRSNFQAHPSHLVSPSPWPLYTSISLLTLTTTSVLSFQFFDNATYFLALCLCTSIASNILWYLDRKADFTKNNFELVVFIVCMMVTLSIIVYIMYNTSMFYVLNPKYIASYIISSWLWGVFISCIGTFFTLGDFHILQTIGDIHPIDYVVNVINHFTDNASNNTGNLFEVEELKQRIGILEFRYNSANDWYSHYARKVERLLNDPCEASYNEAKQAMDKWGNNMDRIASEMDQLKSRLEDID